MQYIKTVSNYDIYFEALPEYECIKSMFSEPEDIEETQQKIESGEWVIFTAKVSALVNGVELGSDYLGACIYESEEAFYNEKRGYMDDMIVQAISEASQNIETINQKLGA